MVDPAPAMAPKRNERPQVEEWPAVLDPAIARAVGFIQERFAEDLDLTAIAREAGLSRTVLRQRFVEMLGDPPMRYCARWRMRVAANMLREDKQNTANIAYAVGSTARRLSTGPSNGSSVSRLPDGRKRPGRNWRTILNR